MTSLKVFAVDIEPKNPEVKMTAIVQNHRTTPALLLFFLLLFDIFTFESSALLVVTEIKKQIVLTLSDMGWGGGTMCWDESNIWFVAYSVLKSVKLFHDFS